MPTRPFRTERWLTGHVRDILDFYYPTCIDDEHGGYIAQLSDRDGHVYDDRSKLLVATARFVFNFSAGTLLDGPEWCHDAAAHGVDFLLDVHRAEDGGYPWLLSGRDVADDARTCYGHAFVLLGLSMAARAGVERARPAVDETAALIDEHFWEDEHGLCKGKLDAEWGETEAYRGQNANMHACEALIAAHETTGEARYLDRAYTIADRLARELADEGDGLVWEHYDADWTHDWTYNRDQPTHLFRPWGYQPGHLLEWTKLLLQLADYREEAWLVERGEHFFEAAVEYGWDDDHGGFVYNVDRDGAVISAEKYYWPLAEGIAAAARLAEATGDDRYWEWYDRIWEYAWEHVVNRDHGTWYFKLTPDNRVHDDIDASPSVKTDYHPLGACYDVIRATGDHGTRRSPSW